MPKQTRKRKLENAEDDDTAYELMAPKNKFRPFDKQAQAEEQELTETLFGGASSFLQSLEEAEQEIGSANVNTDSGVGEEDSDYADESVRKPAWTDEDDDGIDVGYALESQRRKLPKGGVNDRRNNYHDLLKHKFVSAFGTPKWASLNKQRHHSESDDDILQSCGFLREPTTQTLPKSILEFKKVKDLNCETYSEGPYVNCIEFNVASSVALVAGSSGIATLYAVDGKRNNKLHSVAFEHFPIMCAKFLNNGQEAILGSRHSHMFSYDLMAAKAVRVPLPQNIKQFKNFVVSPDSRYIAAAGKWGEVHLLSSISKERIAVLKQNSEVTSLAFNPSSSLLYGHSDTGEITIWDMNMRRVCHKWIDEGCITGTKIAIAPSNQFVATASAEGVVNVYGAEDVVRNKSPKPRKSILNLTTKITDLKFNSSSEVLALASVYIENSFKLYHIGSGTVFSNVPNVNSKFGNINVLNFSPNSGYMAFGNTKSTVSLYRLKHYKNY